MLKRFKLSIAIWKKNISSHNQVCDKSSSINKNYFSPHKLDHKQGLSLVLMHFSEDGSSDITPPNSWKIQTNIINNSLYHLQVLLT